MTTYQIDDEDLEKMEEFVRMGKVFSFIAWKNELVRSGNTKEVVYYDED